MKLAHALPPTIADSKLASVCGVCIGNILSKKIRSLPEEDQSSTSIQFSMEDILRFSEAGDLSGLDP